MIIKIPDLRQSSFSEVYKWLEYRDNIKSVEFEKIKTGFSIEINDSEVTINPKQINGYINTGDSLHNFLQDFDNIPTKIRNELHKELIVFYDSILYVLNKYFGKIKTTIPNNKIIDLINARNCELSIPDTIISASKHEILNYFSKNNKEKIITKSLGGLIRFEKKDEILWGQGTTIVNPSELDIYTEKMFPSLFQKYIDKEYEIRSFYFKGEFYSMAIFSQNDKNTSIDFRNYNKDKPNKMVPFKLPVKIEDKLKMFMNMSNLDTGSIDLILTKQEDNFVFLEVNPFGQFGWLSSNSNYYIEKRIAKYFEDYEN